MECFEEDLTSSKSDGEATVRLPRIMKRDIHRLNTPYGYLDTTTKHNLPPRNPSNSRGCSNITIKVAETNIQNQITPTTNVSNEPMVACDKMDKFRRKLGFHHAYNNNSNKIWIIWLNDIDDEVIHDWEEHVFLKVNHNTLGEQHATLTWWYPVMRNLEEDFIEWKKRLISLNVLMSVVFKMQVSQKINKTCKAMSSWSRQAFGDLYEEPKRLESQIQALEDNSAEFTRFLKLQESIVKRKDRVKCLEGDSNMAYFLNIIRDGRKRSNIRKIMDELNNCMKGNDKIADGLSNFTRILFTYDNTNPDYSSLNILHRCITKEDNGMFCTLPTLKELQDCVFSLDFDSAPRLDGLSGYFYQSTWNIIASDLHKAVTTFFTVTNPPPFATRARPWEKESKHLSFSEHWFYLIHNYISNNWYSIVVNGGRHGFFNSSKGLKKISDICMDFKAKLWWNLRTSSSLWGDYMKPMYLENQHPIKTQWSSSNS
ncbi:hypothetical protein H5410_035462 [Solanum commersonii]|uniref:Uncharacterized protein n=1 Tax=Solanum commersonii TaxID=4109 RepID=A0A9J5Y579_SOLCO|nr:hypothetical protein H5410_035462 [Solanum commersonii]